MDRIFLARAENTGTFKSFWHTKPWPHPKPQNRDWLYRQPLLPHWQPSPPSPKQDDGFSGLKGSGRVQTKISQGKFKETDSDLGSPCLGPVHSQQGFRLQASGSRLQVLELRERKYALLPKSMRGSERKCMQSLLDAYLPKEDCRSPPQQGPRPRQRSTVEDPSPKP